MSAKAEAVAGFGPSPIAPSASLLHRIWPITIIAIGFVLSVGWTGLLGYGLFELASRAF